MIGIRIRRLFQAVTGHAITEIEAEHAEAMLDLEREELRKQVAHYNRGLASHAGLCERLKSQSKRLHAEEADLQTRAASRLGAGDRAAAGRYALRLEAVAAELEELALQLDQAEATYEELVQSRAVAVDAARSKIEGLSRSIGECKVQTALAELTEMASGLQGSIGVNDGHLERLQVKIDEKRDYAAGRVRVARESVDRAEVRAQEAEQTGLADEALARFEAQFAPEASSAEGSASGEQPHPAAT